MTAHKTDTPTPTPTTGHNWDGIEELNNPLPRWWLWTFYATTVWGIIYTILYPAWPLVSGATAGVLGWSTRSEIAADIGAAEAGQAESWQALVDTDLASLPQNEALNHFAVQAGGALFRTNCSQCHGSGAAGAVGYPNLLDDDWLWGGQLEDILVTIRHGVRNEDDPDARYSEMPAFAEMLTPSEIQTLVAHVQDIGQGGDPLAGAGGQLFADNCAACHGDDATGDRTLGAPDLTDAIWLYGNDSERLTRTIGEGPFGVMPAWGGRLGEARVRALAAYVHQLGGGEGEELADAADMAVPVESAAAADAPAAEPAAEATPPADAAAD